MIKITDFQAKEFTVNEKEGITPESASLAETAEALASFENAEMAQAESGESENADSNYVPTNETMPEIPQSCNRNPVLAMLLGLLGADAILALETVTGIFRHFFGVEPTEQQSYLLFGFVVVLFLAKKPLLDFWKQLSQNRHELKVLTYENLADKTKPNVKW